VLEQNMTAFQKGYTKAQHFRICCGITILIHDSILLNRQVRFFK